MKRKFYELSIWIFGSWLSLLTGLVLKFKGESMYTLHIGWGNSLSSYLYLYRTPIEHNYYFWSKFFYVIAAIFLLLFIYQLIITIIKLKRPE